MLRNSLRKKHETKKKKLKDITINDELDFTDTKSVLIRQEKKREKEEKRIS